MQDSNNLRRHAGACRYYREDWNVPGALYRCYCLLDTPPVTAEEQTRCMGAASGCWRFKSEAKGPFGRLSTSAGRRSAATR